MLSPYSINMSFILQSLLWAHSAPFYNLHCFMTVEIQKKHDIVNFFEYKGGYTFESLAMPAIPMP